jgi:DNA-binding MarR family transcriptional regulator
MLHTDGTNLSAIDELIIAVFRLSGSLLEGGSRLVKELGITPAWWQVLGALAISPVPLTVPQIARNMGLARQSVQRIVDLLLEKGFVVLEHNPHHRRAKLVALSEVGYGVYKEAQKRQRPWAAGLAEGLAPESLETAVAILKQIDEKLSEQKGEDEEFA